MHAYKTRTPVQVGDAEADHCMSCNLPFTTIRRRHHCRYEHRQCRVYLLYLLSQELWRDLLWCMHSQARTSAQVRYVGESARVRQMLHADYVFQVESAVTHSAELALGSNLCACAEAHCGMFACGSLAIVGWKHSSPSHCISASRTLVLLLLCTCTRVSAASRSAAQQ
jgi:hypothetical protein